MGRMNLPSGKHTHKTMENHNLFMGNLTINVSCSIAMSNYQMVYIYNGIIVLVYVYIYKLSQ